MGIKVYCGLLTKFKDDRLLRWPATCLSRNDYHACSARYLNVCLCRHTFPILKVISCYLWDVKISVKRSLADLLFLRRLHLMLGSFGRTCHWHDACRRCSEFANMLLPVFDQNWSPLYIFRNAYQFISVLSRHSICLLPSQSIVGHHSLLKHSSIVFLSTFTNISYAHLLVRL